MSESCRLSVSCSSHKVSSLPLFHWVNRFSLSVEVAAYISSGMLPSCCTHSPAKIFIGMCEKLKMSLGDKRLLKRAGENLTVVFLVHQHLCMASASLAPACTVTCFSFDLTIHYNSAVPDLTNTDNKALWLPIYNFDPEVRAQFSSGLRATMCHTSPELS